MTVQDIQYILSLCSDAGQRIADFYHNGNAKIQQKKDLTPVTEADLVANKIITEGLLRRFPDIPIISEENEIPPYSVRKNWTKCWLLDPLDGTREFIGKTGEFAINLALISEKTVTAGFVHLPLKNGTYHAVKDHGCFYTNQEGTRKVETSEFPTTGSKIRVAVSRYHTDEKTSAYVQSLENIEKIAVGSSLKIIEIAEGRLDLYPRLISLSEWDLAAPHIILEEAGGHFVSFPEGHNIQYNTENLKVPAFVASSKKREPV